MGTPQNPGLRQPHLPGRAGRGTGLISVSPPGLPEDSSPACEPRAFDSSISCGRCTRWAFSFSFRSFAPTPHPPTPAPGGWQGLTVTTAQPPGLGDFSKIRNAKQSPLLGPKLSPKLWGDLGTQIKVVTKETASECPG